MDARADNGPRLDLAIETAEELPFPMEEAWFGRVAQAAFDAGWAGMGSVGKARSWRSTLQVVLLLADDATLHELNRTYRKVDRPTDVLSFEGDTDALEGGPAKRKLPKGAPRHLGDIAISVERARRQAEEYGHPFEREMAYLLTHGVLHLLGYDHEADEEQARMRQIEEAALAPLGLTRPA